MKNELLAWLVKMNDSVAGLGEKNAPTIEVSLIVDGHFLSGALRNRRQFTESFQAAVKMAMAKGSAMGLVTPKDVSDRDGILSDKLGETLLLAEGEGPTEKRPHWCISLDSISAFTVLGLTRP